MTLFRVLAKMKGLRGGMFDVFGKTEERRTERALIGEYRAMLDTLTAGLTAANYDTAVALANLPDDIRGFGHVKENNLKAVRARGRSCWSSSGIRRRRSAWRNSVVTRCSSPLPPAGEGPGERASVSRYVVPC